MRIIRIISILIACIILSSCMTVLKKKKKEECDGTYRGELRRGSGSFVVELQNINQSTLSYYRDVKPTFGGDRVIVYFTLDPIGQVADYALYIYREEWILKTYSEKKGWYNVELAKGEVPALDRLKAHRLQITFDDNLIQEEIVKCWNYQMGLEK